MADNPDPFEDGRASRMKALQMADLGTARREHISTVDRPNKLHRTNLQEIEAARDSNKKGTLEFKLAEANREKLNNWATYHETLDENLDTETLDPLLDGQTHRLGLEARLRELGATVHANRGKKPTRGGLSSGRGGGAIGAQSRRPNRPMTLSAPPAGPSGRGGITKSDPHRLTPPEFRATTKGSLAPLSKKLSDPSKDCNNPSTPRGKPERKRYGVPKILPPVTKARRPVFAGPPNVNFESLLADGDDFMAAIPGAQTPVAVKPAPPPAQPPTKLSAAPKGVPVTSENASAVSSAPQVCSIPSVKPVQGIKESPMQTAAPKAKAVAPNLPKPVAAPKPVAPTRIDVFTNPSENRGGLGADAVALKTDHGFGSYVPQPQRMMHSEEDRDDDDLLLYISSEEPVGGRPEKTDNGNVKQENASESLLDTSNEPAEPRREAVQQTETLSNEAEPKEELSATEKDLLKITKLLSNQAMLDPEVALYLQERKDQLEKELLAKQAPVVKKGTVGESAKAPSEHIKPEDPRRTQQHLIPSHPTPSQSVRPAPSVPDPQELQQPAHPNDVTIFDKGAASGSAIKPARYVDPPTKDQLDLKKVDHNQNVEDNLEPGEIKEVKVHKLKAESGNVYNRNVAHEVPGTGVFKSHSTIPHEPPLIIGDHLLPGRSMTKKEPSWPTAQEYRAYKPGGNYPVPASASAAKPIPTAPASFTPRPVFTPAYMQGYTQASTSNPVPAFNPAFSFSQPFSFTYPPAPGVTPAPVSTSFQAATIPSFAPAPKPETEPVTNTAPINTASANTAPTAPKSRFKMRDTPQFPITAATMQYYSGSLAPQQIKPPTTPTKKTNENTNPFMNFATPQPIEPGQKDGFHSRKSSSPLSPAAPTFQPHASGRDSTSFGFGASTSGRSTANHHSIFSSTASVAPREPKNVFVAEMAKHGVSVSGVPVTNVAAPKKKNGMESSKYAH